MNRWPWGGTRTTRPTRVWRFPLTAALALFTLAACESPLEPLPEDTPRTASVQFVHEGVWVELETSLSSLHLRPGDSVAVTTTIRNVGDESVTFSFAQGCPFGFGVLDPGGSELPGLAWRCFTFSYGLTLAPGEEHSATRYWDGHVEWGGGRRPVRAGIYGVYGVFYWAGPPVPLEVRKVPFRFRPGAWWAP